MATSVYWDLVVEKSGVGTVAEIVEAATGEHLIAFVTQIVPETPDDGFIDAVNEDGYLTQSLDEIYLGLDPSLDVDPEEVEAVLHLVQHFDPTGVAARVGGARVGRPPGARSFGPDLPGPSRARVVQRTWRTR